jgi:hypothetical protein
LKSRRDSPLDSLDPFPRYLIIEHMSNDTL